MVTENHAWEEQTRRLLSEAQAELNSLEEQIFELHEKQAKLADEVDAYEMALKGYLTRTGRKEVAEHDWINILANDKYHKDRLVTIAKHNGGKITQSKATDILFGNKLIKAKKRATAYAMVQGYLSDMAEQGLFRKLGPGEYQLLGAQQKMMS
jgi:predicted nuclease with TOPRIM domain